MKPKIEKLKAEREKNCTKISNLQSRNKVIDSQVMELENLDIIEIVRDSNITLDMLAEIIKAMKEKPRPVASTYHEETEETTDEN